MDISAFIEIAKELHVLGIKITKDGELMNEWYSEEECRRNIYSAAKSFTSCAVGFAVQEGLISLDEKLTDAFAEDLPEVIDENLQMATVRDLLTMCLGQEQGSLMGVQRPTWEIDPLGNNFGAGGLFLTLSELHKFGLFYLNKGKWEGRQILSAQLYRHENDCKITFKC